MARSSIIRLLTLASFGILLSAFILYRSGSLDTVIYNDQPSPYSLNLAANYSDSTPTKGKRIVIPDDAPANLVLIRNYLREKDSLYIDSLNRKLFLLSSSKSGSVFQDNTRENILKSIDSLSAIHIQIYDQYLRDSAARALNLNFFSGSKSLVPVLTSPQRDSLDVKFKALKANFDSLYLKKSYQ